MRLHLIFQLFLYVVLLSKLLSLLSETLSLCVWFHLSPCLCECHFACIVDKVTNYSYVGGHLCTVAVLD